MRDATVTAGAPGSRGLGRPLLWSAAGHVVALAACLVIGADGGAGVRRLPVVEVLLVADDAGAGWSVRSGTSSAGLSPRTRGRPLSPADADAPSSEVEVPAPVAAPAPSPAAGTSSSPAGPGPAMEPGLVRAGPAPPGVPRGPAAGPAGSGAGEGGTAGAAAGPVPRDDERDGEGGAAGVWSRNGLLRDRIQSRIVYPEEAVRRGLEGEVLLRIRIETGGNPGEVRVARSSGARLLDEAARRGVVRAAPLPASPGWVEVPVLFRLR